MIQFNELRIDASGNFLIIDVSVTDDIKYETVSISNIIIDNLDTYIDTGPSSNPVYVYEVPKQEYDKVYESNDKCQLIQEETEYQYCYVNGNNLTKNVRLKLRLKDFNNIDSLSDNIFFVYVIALMESPCGIDSFTRMCTAVYLYPLYQNIMGFIKELGNECAIPKGLIDSVLRLLSIEASIKSGNYNTAIKYWKKFYKNETKIVTPKPCGCYGRT